MARRHSQPLLPFERSVQDSPPEPTTPDTIPLKLEGGAHAVQDDGTRTAGAAAGDVRAAAQAADVAADDGTAGQRVEGQPPSVGGNARPGEAGQRPQADRQRSAGDSAEGTGG